MAQSGRRSRVSHHPDDLAPGSIIGERYRVERRLGGGAIGNVFECTNTWTTRRVALKLLRRDFADDPEIAQRFLIEARAATTVAHPNIVDVLDMGEDAESRHLYLVQEFLEGRDLHEHLKEHRQLTLESARDVLVPVMHALSAAHEKGVLHRDLKPENVFLVTTSEGELVPKVIDFGLARTSTTAMNRVTRVGAVMGTPFYMSPEQGRGEIDLDAATDVWAMGVIWYECLAGALPFEGDNLQAVLHQIFMVDPVRLEVRVPGVPVAIADAIHRALARDRAKRFGSMAEFLDAMLDLLPTSAAPAPGLRSSRPATRPSRAASGAARASGATATPAPTASRSKLHLGPPRRPDAPSSDSDDDPPAAPLAATVHATPARGTPPARVRSGAFSPYTIGTPPAAAATPTPPRGLRPTDPAPTSGNLPGNAPLDTLRHQVRVLRALLGLAVFALLTVSAVALVALRREARPGVTFEPHEGATPSPSPAPRRPVGPIAREPSTDAAAVGGDAVVGDDAAVGDDANGHSGRHSRSRDGGRASRHGRHRRGE